LLKGIVVAGGVSCHRRLFEHAEAGGRCPRHADDYRDEIATYLGQVVIDRADFRNSLIGAPMLKQVGAGEHYMVCVQLNGHNQHKDMVVIYLGTKLNQFIDATPGQCADAAYQPFKELAALLPPT